MPREQVRVLVEYQQGTHINRKPFREISVPFVNPLLAVTRRHNTQKVPANQV